MSPAWAAVLALLGTSLAGAAVVPQDRIEGVMKGASVHQTIGPVETPLSRELADFFLDHPDLAASIVREHGIAPYRIALRGPRSFWADDGEGTTGLISETESGPGRRAYYGEGVHKSRLFPGIHAEAVIILEMRSAAGCAPRVRSTFDVYVKLRNPVLSRMVSLLPFVRNTVMRKFSKALFVADQVGRLLARTPQAVARDIERSGLPEEDRRRALELIRALASRPPACRN